MSPVHVAMRTRVQNWTHVVIAAGLVHWSTGPNPSPRINALFQSIFLLSKCRILIFYMK